MPPWNTLLRPGDRVIAAVSGGPDSVLMFHVLLDEARHVGWDLHVVHVNHHLSGELSDADAAWVAQLAARHDVPFCLRHVDSAALERDSREGLHSTSLEARLREERLRLLREEAARIGARAIALGHNATDAAETFLLMALRGSGSRGLGSLRPVRWIEPDGPWIVRPVISLERREVLEELARRGITEWREDPMNATTRVRRNKLRHLVLPQLGEIEPAAVRLLARSAEWCAEDAELLDGLVERLLTRARRAGGSDWVLLDAGVLRAQGEAACKAILRVECLRIARTTDAQHIILPINTSTTEALVARIATERGDEAQFDTGQGVVVRVTGSRVLVAREDTDPGLAWARALAGEGALVALDAQCRPIALLNSAQRFTPARYEIPLPHGQGLLRLTVQSVADFQPDWADERLVRAHRAVFDVRSLRRDIALRAPAEPDTMPIGQGASRAVLDVLRDAHVPSVARRFTAVFADDRGPLWIPGIRRAVSAYVTPRTELVLAVDWIPRAASHSSGTE